MVTLTLAMLSDSNQMYSYTALVQALVYQRMDDTGTDEVRKTIHISAHSSKSYVTLLCVCVLCVCVVCVYMCVYVCACVVCVYICVCVQSLLRISNVEETLLRLFHKFDRNSDSVIVFEEFLEMV